MARSKGKGWHDESRRHSLARKGIRTARRPMPNEYDGEGRGYLPANRLVAGGIKYLGEGPSMHGYLDRSYDTYRFEDENGELVEVILFTEPDYDGIKAIANEENMTDAEYEEFASDMRDSFYEPGHGEVEVIWAGTLDFNGTEDEFAEAYPDLNKFLGLGSKASNVTAKWKKVAPNIGSTLRGHIPIAKWSRGKEEDGVVEIYKMTSGRGKGNYFVEIWGGMDKIPTESKTFTDFNDAKRFALKTMEKMGA